jgi:hypothetical protein
MSSVMQNIISFDEIVKGRHCTVRVTADGFIYVIDLVVVVTGQSRDHAGKTIRNLSNEVFPSEKISERQFSTRGGVPTKLITFQDALELVMVLPGKVAKETRTKFASIIKRYMAGDESLVDEIRTNAVSTSPLAQLARVDEDDKKRKRVIEDMELEERRLRMTEMAANTQRLFAEAHKCEADAQRMLMEDYASLCPNKTIDDRARLMFKDYCLNLVSCGTHGAITNGNAPITISNLATKMGYKFNTTSLIAIGAEVAKRYKAKYGVAPSKHEQQCGGAVRLVCSYSEKDHGLVEEVLLDWNQK